jgi:tetratricopeptide (TPR) repeat protein
MKCPNCGFENPDDFAFCGKCGTKLEAASEPRSADRQTTVRQLKEAGDHARHSADWGVALERYQQALTMLDSVITVSDTTLQAQLLKQRFDILAERWPLWERAGQSERIEPDLKEMLTLARRSGDGVRLSKAITALARFYFDQQLDEPARPLLEEAVSLLHTQNDWSGEAGALADLARVNWRAGRFDTVAESLQRAHELRRRVAEPSGLARSFFDLGLLYRDGLSQPVHAVAHFEKTIEFARPSGEMELETRCLIELGASWTRLGDYAQAKAVLDQAQAQAASIVLNTRLFIAQAERLRETGSADAGAAAERAQALASDLKRLDLEWGALLMRVTIGHAWEEWAAVVGLLDRMQEIERAGGLHAYCSIWSISLLARSQLYNDQHDLAVATSTRALDLLQNHGLAGVPTPQGILWQHFEVLSAAKDPSAFHYLRQARETMLTQANTINDGALRAHFLRDVSINRLIGDDWTRRHM